MRGGGGGALPKSDSATVGGRLGLRRRGAAPSVTDAAPCASPLMCLSSDHGNYAANSRSTSSTRLSGMSCATVVLPSPVLSTQRRRAPALFLSLAAAASKLSGVAAERS